MDFIFSFIVVYSYVLLVIYLCIFSIFFALGYLAGEITVIHNPAFFGIMALPRQQLAWAMFLAVKC